MSGGAQARNGRIGGLTAWARHGPEVMVSAAHAAFRRRFENQVDPDGTLDPRERMIRAERARRAYMLSLAAKSAAVRRKRKVDPSRPGSAQAEEDKADVHPTP